MFPSRPTEQNVGPSRRCDRAPQGGAQYALAGGGPAAALSCPWSPTTTKPRSHRAAGRQINAAVTLAPLTVTVHHAHRGQGAAGGDLRPLRTSGGAQPRRHGRRVARLRRRARPARSREAHPAGIGHLSATGRGVCQALPPRGPHHRAHPAPRRAAGVRRSARRVVRAAVPGDGTSRRCTPVRLPGPRPTATGQLGGRRRRAGCDRAVVRARRPGDPPRPQAGQHPRRTRRHREGPRLRHRCDAAHRRHQTDRHR